LAEKQITDFEYGAKVIQEISNSLKKLAEEGEFDEETKLV